MNTLLKFSGKDLQDITMDEWLEQKPEALRPLATKWFSIIQQCGSDVQSIFHDNYPIGCVCDAPFAYVNIYTSHVNLGFFHGAALYDKTGLLEGSGKHMRHIKLKPDVNYDDNAILTLIELAYADIKERLTK